MAIMDWAIPGALGVSGFLAGILGDDDDNNDSSKAMVKSAKISSRKAYPGQGKVAKELSSYLFENLDMGLTEKEKQTYRGTGRTSVLQGIQASQAQARKAFSSQGLRGGSVADTLSRISESAIPEFAGIEAGISLKDMELKRKRIAEILAFLGLEAGNKYDSNNNNNTSRVVSNNNRRISNYVIGGLPGIGGGESGDDGLGLGLGGGDIGDSSGVGGMDSYGGGEGIGGY